MMPTTARCGGASGPATWSLSNSAPSRSEASGVFSSCDKWRRNRFFCASSSVSRRRSQSRRVAQVAQVLRPADADRLREVGAAELADAGVELGDRPRDDARQRQRDGERHRDGGEHQLHDSRRCTPSAAAPQPLDLAVGDAIADRQHLVRALGELGHPGADGARIRRACRQRRTAGRSSACSSPMVRRSAASCSPSSGRRASSSDNCLKLRGAAARSPARSSASGSTASCCASRSIEPMRFTRARLPRAACAALYTALRLCSARCCVFHAEYSSAPASGTATRRNPVTSKPRKERG